MTISDAPAEGLAPDHLIDAPGMACILLTPLGKRTIRELPPRAVLEVRTDDPAAREGIPSWCRLTQNELVETIEHDRRHTTFRIRHTGRTAK